MFVHIISLIGCLERFLDVIAAFHAFAQELVHFCSVELVSKGSVWRPISIVPLKADVFYR